MQADKATGKEHKISITNSSGLSKDDVERMVQDAKAHEQEDKARREAVDKRNNLDGLIAHVEKLLAKHKDKMPAEEVTEIEEELKKAKEVISREEQSLDVISKAAESLSQLAGSKLAAFEQQAGQADAHTSEATHDTNTDSNESTIDADFEQK